MDPTESSRAVVTSWFAALARGDGEALRELLAPDATWTLGGDMPVSGTWRGREEILDGFLARLFERVDTTHPVTQDVHHVLADGEHAVAEWTSRARAVTGRDYRNDYAAVFTVRDGLVRHVAEYTDTARMARVLFPPAPATA